MVGWVGWIVGCIGPAIPLTCIVYGPGVVDVEYTVTASR